MQKNNDESIIRLVDDLFSDQYYYNTDAWVEKQKELMNTMGKAKDFSAVSYMFEVAYKRKHFQVIEYVCSHLNEFWINKLWNEIRTLISCKSRDARFRAVSLYSYYAQTLVDYIEIIYRINDDYQDVRLKAYHWIIENRDLVVDIIHNNSIPDDLSMIKEVYDDISAMTLSEIDEYIGFEHSILTKKIIFLVYFTKATSSKVLVQFVEKLDDQDVFDYFHRYTLS